MTTEQQQRQVHHGPQGPHQRRIRSLPGVTRARVEGEFGYLERHPLLRDVMEVRECRLVIAGQHIATVRLALPPSQRTAALVVVDVYDAVAFRAAGYHLPDDTFNYCDADGERVVRRFVYRLDCVP